MSSNTSVIRLLTQEDWITWYNYIKSEAKARRIWRYVDPEETNPPVNAPPDLEYYTKKRTLPTLNTNQEGQGQPVPELEPSQTSSQTSSDTPITPATPSDSLEKFLAKTNTTGRWNAYKMAYEEYIRMDKGLTALNTLIHTTAGPNYQGFIDDMTNPHAMLKLLANVAKPSDAQLRRTLDNELDRLQQGPKRLGLEAWLQLHLTIAKKAERIDDPPREATKKYLIRHFIRACQDINPSIFSAYSLQAEENTLDITLEDLIKKFNVSYQPPKRRAAAVFPTLSGEPTDPKRPSQDREHCQACGGEHIVEQCWNLFEELRPDGWVVNERRERRCQAYLKTQEGKTIYTEQKRTFAESPPSKPQPPSRRKNQRGEPQRTQSPPPTIAMVLPSGANLNIKNLFLYDSGAELHITNNINYLHDYEEVEPTTIDTGDNSSTILGYGEARLTLEYGKRKRLLILRKVAYCPGFHTNIVCGDALFNAGIKIDQEKNQLVYRHTEQLFSNLTKHGRLYFLKGQPQEVNNPSVFAVNSRELFKQQATKKVWHQRMGHCDMESISNLPLAAEGVSIVEAPKQTSEFGQPLCEPCVMAKLQRQISRRPPTLRARTPFERIHFDIVIMGRGYGGATCIAHFWCEKTKYHRAWPLPNHQQHTLLPIFEATVAFAKKFTIGGIKWFRSDDEQGIGDTIENYLRDDGIEWEVSTPYNPNQNGPAERSGRSISERGRALTYEANLPEFLWSEIVTAGIYLLNRTPIRSLGWRTPYEHLYGKKPNLYGIRILGSLTYILIVGKKRDQLSKFDPRALKGYLVGFEASNIYRVWSPITNRVIRTRDVKVDETQRYRPDTNLRDVSVQEMEEIRRIQDIVDIFLNDEVDWIEDVEALANIQPPTLPNLPLPLFPEPPKEDESNPLITPPSSTPEQGPSTSNREPSISDQYPTASQPDIRQDQPPTNLSPESSKRTASSSGGEGPERRSKRQKTQTQKAMEMPNQDLRRKAFFSSNDNPQGPDDDPVYEQAYRAFAIATARSYGHRDEMPPPPKSWKEMMNHPMAQHFRAAAHREMRALITKQTWDEVILPLGARAISTKWVFTYKEDVDGYITKFKARLCVRGDLQLGVHKRDVYAITATFKTFRLLMALVAAFDLDVIHLDAVNAFVNANVDEEVYITMPEGYREGRKDIVLKLRKALYGLRKSPKLWFIEISATLRRLGLIPVPDEPCLFVHPTRPIMIFFYVDDILLMATKPHLTDLEELATNLANTYEIRRMKEFNQFLNIRIIRDRPNRRLYLSQDQYIDKLVTQFNQEYAKLPFTPLSGQDLKPFEGEATLGEINAYQVRIGSIIYPATTLRADIAYAATKLAEFMQNPSQAHLAEVHQVIAYLNATRYLAIEYSNINPYETDQTQTQVLKIAADASFADDMLTRRSSQGYLIKLFNGPIMWQSSKQKTVSTSTTEAELLSLSHVGKEVQHMARIFKAIRFDPEQELQIECDNQQTVRIVSNQLPTISTKLRHIDIHQFWLRQEVQDGKFVVQWIPSSEMPADGLTKPLTKQLHQAFIDMLGLRDIRHLIT